MLDDYADMVQGLKYKMEVMEKQMEKENQARQAERKEDQKTRQTDLKKYQSQVEQLDSRIQSQMAEHEAERQSLQTKHEAVDEAMVEIQGRTHDIENFLTTNVLSPFIFLFFALVDWYHLNFTGHTVDVQDSQTGPG